MKRKRILYSAVAAIVLLGAGFTLYHPPKTFLDKTPPLIFQNGKGYQKEWAKVDSLWKKRLTRSALEVVDEIHKKAKDENNSPQIAKALIHKLKFESNIEEENYIKAIYDLSVEIDNSYFPLKPVLHSFLAEIYWRYYQNNRWKFLNRTETVAFKNDDIRTWDLKKIVQETMTHYNLSLQSADSLKRTRISHFNDILLLGDSAGRKLRPTLYDFLAHRASGFFMHEEPGLTKPAYKFELAEPWYFDESEIFVEKKIETKDSLSLKYHASIILQEMVRFHLNDDDPKALIDAELQRLKFAKNNSIHASKDSLYLAVLNRLEKKFSKHPSSAEVAYQIALWHFNKGEKYAPQTDAVSETASVSKWAKKTAAEICEQTIQKFPNSYGAQQCATLLARIREKSLSFVSDNVELPGKDFRSLIQYKNLEKIHVRICQFDYDSFRKKTRKLYGKELMDYYKKLNSVKEWVVELPADSDHHQHSVEIKMPELPLGFYVVLVGSDKGFSYSENAIAYGNLWISNISYLTRQRADGSYGVSVLHREVGEPLRDVSAQLFYRKYNYVIRDYEYKKIGSYVTDENGYFRIPPSNNYRNFYIDFRKGDDRLSTDNNYYQYRYYKDNKKRIKTFFFTDRAIYRPGQTIHFKGIVIETDPASDGNAIKSGFSSTVELMDVNSQKVSELKLTTNEYGTFSGTFTAPTSSLNGNMHIENSYGSVYFSVEEYKRPKFEVKFDPIKGSFKLGEQITAKGLAKAYAGSVIDGAEVSYRVVRNATFPYWWYWRGYYPTSAQMEVTNGTTRTNEKGEFEIEFTAIPDKSIDKKFKPTYTFTVYADVTDINGETHSAQQYVRVGYTALELSVNVPEKLNLSSKDTFQIRTTNLAGEPEPAQGSVNIHRLQTPDRTFRKRNWSRPDKFLMTKEEFYAAFPKDVYDNENDIHEWPKSEQVFSKKFDTEKSKDLLLKKLKDWPQGDYVMEATAIDKFGEEVKEIKYFTVFSDAAKTQPTNDVNWFTSLKKIGEPGETAAFLIGSKENVKVLYEIEHKNKIVKREWFELNNEQRKIEISIQEKHRGNFAVYFTFVKENRFYANNQLVIVPRTDKQLDIEFETFRNKLNPGQQEEWKIKIKGPKGEKVAAEMLATLYDASLDAFRANNWALNIYQNYYANLLWRGSGAFNAKNSRLFHQKWNVYPTFQQRKYDRLNWFGFNFYGYYGYRERGARYLYADADMAFETAEAEETVSEVRALAGVAYNRSAKKSKDKNREGKPDLATGLYKIQVGEFAYPASGVDLLVADETLTQKVGGLSAIKARTNFNETAFFYPHLQTNEKGEIVIKFTIPEALTKWKFMGLAHTKDLKTGQIFEETVTQKELMIMPNAPRFFREGDRMTFTAKISNLSEKDINGQAELTLYDALTMKEITHKLVAAVHGKFPTIGYREFTAKKDQSTVLKWEMMIPDDVSAITYKVVAKAGKFSDGEEMAVPVLTNRMLVTESLPLPVKGNESKEFRFEKLINSGQSKTLKHHKLTLEYTSNPAWYAIQALPYMMEYPYECSEQIFSRFYANSIASHIANSSPKIKAVFDSWKSQSPEALLSNLEKNQELKSLMLEETPWVLDAKNETERKKRVGVLFDLNKMANELGSALKKLEKAQVANGGWTWFPGMKESRYITQHIVTGFGHLDHLGVENVRKNPRVWRMVKKAIPYLDNRIREDYDWVMKHAANPEDDHIGHTQIQYLYARSYFKDIKIGNRNQKAFDYYFKQAKKYWVNKSRYMQGMIALGLHRYDEKTVPADIMKSLKENAIFNEEMGMYWKENYGYYWYQAPIESQALMVEAFDEVANDQNSVNELKVWLLKQKQTTDWKTTKATAEACYALLLKGADWLASDDMAQISLGEMKINPKEMDDVKVEAGTGYFKTSWGRGEIKPEMGEVKVIPPQREDGGGVSWGALYWQYFEQLDKITPHETPLKLKKQLFIEKSSDTGPVITPISEKTKLQVGDKIKVRIELRVDRNMEFVHMKDMRASGFEPINVISRYKWQDGLGYYESTKDAATNFFFDRLPKGTYVFEYPLRVTHEGNFSNGITTIQCMYAPEFASHSEGIRVKVGQ